MRRKVTWQTNLHHSGNVCLNYPIGIAECMTLGILEKRTVFHKMQLLIRTKILDKRAEI